MQHIAVIRYVDGRLAWYPPGASEEPLWLDDDQVREDLIASLLQRKLSPCFAAPGADLRLLPMTVSAQEKKHISQSLPFMLEEQVAQDIEELHFASCFLNGNHLGVGICTVEKMQEWQQELADFPGITRWIPEPLLLPWQEGEWCLLLEGDRAIVRTGECEGCTIERDMVALLLDSAGEEGAPGAIVVYGQDQAADTALLPAQLRETVQWRRGNLISAMLLSELSATPLNLLQGNFAPRLPLDRWWRQWRAVAVVSGLAIALQLLATYADYRQLSSENLALRAAVQDSYRRAYPKGAVVDAEKQLRRQLDALRGSAQTSGFVSLMERVGGVIASSPGTSIASINYSDKGDELRMNIVAANYEAVERVRENINSAGLQAVMESSSAQGNKVRARLRVGEPS